MSAKQDIKRAENIIKDVEDYVKKRIWNPYMEKETIAMITEAELLLNQTMAECSDNVDAISKKQASLVSNLSKRLQETKNNLPSRASTDD